MKKHVVMIFCFLIGVPTFFVKGGTVRVFEISDAQSCSDNFFLRSLWSHFYPESAWPVDCILYHFSEKKGLQVLLQKEKTKSWDLYSRLFNIRRSGFLSFCDGLYTVSNGFLRVSQKNLTHAMLLLDDDESVQRCIFFFNIERCVVGAKDDSESGAEEESDSKAIILGVGDCESYFYHDHIYRWVSWDEIKRYFVVIGRWFHLSTVCAIALRNDSVKTLLDNLEKMFFLNLKIGAKCITAPIEQCYSGAPILDLCMLQDSSGLASLASPSLASEDDELVQLFERSGINSPECNGGARS